jgi:CelD/BcsL family acetyltransferase involved in cellulose biosynthesis
LREGTTLALGCTFFLFAHIPIPLISGQFTAMLSRSQAGRMLCLCADRATKVIKLTHLSRVRSAQTTNGLSIEVATSVGELLARKADYDSLLRATGNTLPFTLHEWHVAWCNHLCISRSGIRTQPLIHFARDSDGQCVAIVPLILTRRALGPIWLGTLDMLGADPALTEIRTSLILPGYEARVVWALQPELSSVREVDWLDWGVLSDSHADALAVRRELSFRTPLLDYVLDLPADYESFRSSLKRNVRESIRHCYNSLKRQGLTCELRVAEAPAAVAEALERFFTLHAMRADLQGTVVHRNHFATVRARSFLREVCTRLAGRNIVRIFQLAIRGEIVAARIGFVIGDSLYLYYSGFDPRWSKYSVMTTTLVEAIRYAIANGIKTVNLSPAKDHAKTRWSPREIALVQAVQVSRSPLSRFAWSSFQRLKSGNPPPTWVGRFLRQSVRDWQ